VKGPSVEDWEQLSKLLVYLRGTVVFVMRLKLSALFHVVAYIDASFWHIQMESHIVEL
jgi:hypothetical protein